MGQELRPLRLWSPFRLLDARLSTSFSTEELWRAEVHQEVDLHHIWKFNVWRLRTLRRWRGSDLPI